MAKEIRTAISELFKGQWDDMPEQLEGDGAEMEQADAIDGNNVRRLYGYDSTAGREQPQAVITKDVVVDGSITAQAGLLIAGRVEGNVKCQSRLSVSGEICGDLTAQEIETHGARICGNLLCAGKARIDEKTVLSGDLTAAELELRGNLSVEGASLLGGQAFVLGDIQSGTIEMERGAKISGRVQMKSCSKEILDSFPDVK